ncbi:hypothetical protein PG984_005121 [Apiospora sp. TS-2023a]
MQCNIFTILAIGSLINALPTPEPQIWCDPTLKRANAKRCGIEAATDKELIYYGGNYDSSDHSVTQAPNEQRGTHIEPNVDGVIKPYGKHRQ